jgi:hypothetical protein
MDNERCKNNEVYLLTMEYAKFRPRIRWLEYIENHLRELKLKKWKPKASNNSEEWTLLIKAAIVLRGL